MPTERSYRSYPPEYGDLFRRALNSPVRMELGSNAEAKNTRLHLYAYRRALKAEPSAPEDLKLIAQMISLTVKDSAVIAHMRKKLPSLKELKQ